MPARDIIDNRHERLVDHIQRLLPSTERAKFAVGYFFLSGLEGLGQGLDSVQELRLLIGNTTNRETLEQLTGGYKRLDLVERRAEERRFAKRADRQQVVAQTAANLRESVEVMDQTDAGEKLVQSLARMIEQGRLKVRVYTKGRLHAKAYIFDYKQPNPGNEGIAIVGSSNLTLAGIQDNTELNVLVPDNGRSSKTCCGRSLCGAGGGTYCVGTDTRTTRDASFARCRTRRPRRIWPATRGPTFWLAASTSTSLVARWTPCATARWNPAR